MNASTALDIINDATTSIERMIRWAVRHPGLAAIERFESGPEAGTSKVLFGIKVAIERIAPVICEADGHPTDKLHVGAIIDEMKAWADDVRFDEGTRLVGC